MNAFVTALRLRGDSMRTWLVAVVLAAGCAAVLHTHVYTDFDRVRIRVVTSARHATAGKVVAALPDLDSLAGQPAVLVLRLSNTGGAPSRVVRATAGGSVLGEGVVPPGPEVRVDLSVSDGAVLAGARRIELTGGGDGWTLTYLEVANVHGFSSGLFAFNITPATARTPQRLGALAGVPAFGLLLALGLLSRRIAHRRARVSHVVASLLVTSFLAAVLAAPFVSDFVVQVAAHTFLVCLLVLYYPALAAVAREARPVVVRVWARTQRAVAAPVDRSSGRGAPSPWVEGDDVAPAARWLRAGRHRVNRTAGWLWTRRVPLVYAAMVVVFVGSIARWYDPDTGLTTLIRFGERYEHRVLPSVRAVPREVHADSPGYDGQFYAQMAADPLLRDPAIHAALDAPAYRARRILFSWTAYVAGLGRPAWVVHAYALQHVVAWLLLAWVLCRWFPPTSSRNLALWFGCLFSEGLVFSVLTTVPDGPGMLLLVLGVAAMEGGRKGRAAVVVGLACLAKSTNILWSAMVVGPDDVQRPRWRGLLLRGVLVAGPGAAWMSYLLVGGVELGGFAELVGGGGSTNRNFGLPFSGYMGKWTVTLAELRAGGWDSLARFNLLALIGLTTQVMVLLAVRDWRNPWWRAGIGSVLLMPFLGPAVWEGHPGAVTRVLLPMTFAFNATLPRVAWFWPLYVLGNLSVLYSLDALRI